jgi:hypothetical protein
LDADLNEDSYNHIALTEQERVSKELMRYGLAASQDGAGT